MCVCVCVCVGCVCMCMLVYVSMCVFMYVCTCVHAYIQYLSLFCIYIHSYRSNIDLSSDVDNSALACRWYYEVTVNKVTMPNNHHLRVGWIDVEQFTPALGTFGEQLGSDYSSVGFDGTRVWTGGHLIEQYKVIDNNEELQPNSRVTVNDVFGCCLDTVEGRVCFTHNGVRVGPDVVMRETSKRFTAAVSFSSGVE